MRILVGCEFSGRVRSAFRARGHDAWSADFLPAGDGSPHHLEWDVLELLDGGWDMAIFHPPCTDLSCSGARHFPAKIADGRQGRAIEFVRTLMNAPIPRIAVENPVGVLSSHIRKPDQIIQPYQFGENAAKGTCLWLKGLPPLVPTEQVPPAYYVNGLPRWGNQSPCGANKLGPSPDRWKKRSLTYKGIAAAMAAQWGEPA